MQHIKELLIVAMILIYSGTSSGQSRWIHSYYDNGDVFAKDIIESYDHGYLISGKHGANYSKYNWLIKTDINGEILWEKTIGDGLNTIALLDMIQDDSGNIYLGGGTNYYDPESDPIVLKINSCGEKEWCRVFYKENHYSFACCLTLTQDGSVAIAIFQTNPEPWIDRICLAKLSPEGELVWRHCYTSADTSQRFEDIYDIILTPDHGFLLNGFCYYEDPEIPDHWIPHPYLLKTDSSGNFQWETVVFKETNMYGGVATSTTISPNLQHYYSSIGRVYYDTNLISPALVKLDLDGNVLGVFDVVYGYKNGKLNYSQFISDSVLAASAGWGNTDDSLWSRAVLIDTLGNLINSIVLVEDIYTSMLDITYDGKLVYASNTFQNGQFDCFVTKLNQDLEQDTIYTMPFAYDSLCPYQIVSDTIVQDDCGLIVGIPELEEKGRGGEEERMIELWPNPCSSLLSISLTSPQPIENCTIQIYDVYGRLVKEELQSPSFSGSEKEASWKIDVSNLPIGLYLATVKDGQKVKASSKILVAR